MRNVDETIQVAINDALKNANPFYAGLAKPYIPLLEHRILEALAAEGYTIVETKAWADLKGLAQRV